MVQSGRTFLQAAYELKEGKEHVVVAMSGSDRSVASSDSDSGVIEEAASVAGGKPESVDGHMKWL